MKILFICHRIPYPPTKGDKLRAYNILKHLAKSHEIDLVCMADTPDELEYIPKLKSYARHIHCKNLHPFKYSLNYVRFLFSKYPLTLGHFYSASFKREVEGFICGNKYDLIYVFSAAMSQYVTDIDHIPKVLDLVDADCEKWLSYAKYASFPKSAIYNLEGNRTRKYEMEISGKFDAVTVVSESEKKILIPYIPNEKLFVVGNGLDQSLYKGYQHIKKPDEQNLLFVGGMFYFAYIDGILHFYKDAFNRIKKAFPQVKFHIVGADPAASILKLNNDPNVSVTGYVDDLMPYLTHANVYVVPLRMAPGIQNKILEAMAMNIPVVSTHAAIQGIDAVDGKDILLADRPEEFADAVISLFRQRTLRERLSANALELITDKYDWYKNLSKLDQILKCVCKK